MNAEKMGRFIAELRKSKNLTQKELAVQLNVTDKAVSKWERGLSCPDISLLMPLAELLDISVSELLNGERNVPAPVEEVLTYAEKNVAQKTNHFRNLSAWIFTGVMLLALIICAVCNYAASREYYWSLYPISSILLAWAIIFPLIKFPKNGILISLTAFSLLIIPFLIVINSLVKAELLLIIGIRVSRISIILLWMIYAVFRIFRKRKFLASGIALILLAIACLLINIVVAQILHEPVIDIWDILSFMIMLILSIVFIIKDRQYQK